MLTRKRLMFAGMLIVILGIVSLARTGSQLENAAPSTITVPNNYPTIQQAINAANPGDTVFVRNGTYHENVLVNKTLNLIGENNQTTIIDGGGIGTVMRVSASGLTPGSADNVTIANFTLTNGGSGPTDSSLTVDGVEGCNVTGIRDTTDPTYGIWLNNSWYSTLDGNYVTNSEYGILITYSISNWIRNNNLANNSYGILLATSSNNTLCSNSIVGAILYALYLTASNYNNVSRNQILNNYAGAYIESSSYNNFRKNTFQYNNFAALWLSNSPYNCFVKNCITSNSQYGLYLGDSSYNTISRNFLKGNSNFAAYFDSSNYNLLQRNEFYNNSVAIQGYNSSNNNVIGNNFTSNYERALSLALSYDNNIYYNNFKENFQDVYLNNSINKWDSGSKWGGGNYWADSTNVDQYLTGIGSFPHTLDANNTDNYPLMGLYYSRNFSQGMLDVITNSNVWGLHYYPSNGTVEVQVSNTTAYQSTAFARFTIPYSLMNPTNLSVSVNGGMTPLSYSNYTLNDNGTYRWIYIAFPMSTPNNTIDIIPAIPPITPEFPSFLALTIMAALLLAVVAYKRKQVRLA